MSTILYGKKIADALLSDLAIKVKRFHEEAINCSIAVILVGDDPASKIYVRNKLIAAESIGIIPIKLEFSKDITTDFLLQEISKLNKDPKVSGIIVQLPLPHHIDSEKVLSFVDPKKDVDGFHPINIGLLHSGSTKGFVPCTALGCLELIKYCHPNLTGKKVVIVGRSNIVGKPLSALLLSHNCTVTICHSKTQELESITNSADIVICAIGRPHFFTNHYFKSGATIIDVGINRVENPDGTVKIVGDVDFDNVFTNAKYITPVPKGVGPLTIAFLLSNTVIAAGKIM